MSALIDFLKKEEVKQYIGNNLTADPTQLLLNPPSDFKEHIKEIAAQIQARQKAKGKLEEWSSNLNLIMPPPLSIEQASSDLTCDYKKQLVSGRHLIDLTGGMGIDFLALSEAFDQSTYVEKEMHLCEVFEHNAEVFENDVKVIHSNAEDYLQSLESNPEKTVIYLDPARRDDSKGKVFKIEDCSPNLIDLLPLLEQKASKVLIKYSPILDIQAILRSIPHIKEIHIVSVKNDCKELLILVDFKFEGTPEIRCVNLATDQLNYTFKIEDEKSSSIGFEDLDQYLFESNSSIMKAGVFKKIAIDFNLGKIAENTHLYTSNAPIKNFPGRTFKVLEEADKRNLKQFAPTGKINVITRNHPLNANVLKKKWKLKDGGDYYLIAFRDQRSKAKMVIAQRLDL